MALLACILLFYFALTGASLAPIAQQCITEPRKSPVLITWGLRVQIDPHKIVIRHPQDGELIPRFASWRAHHPHNGNHRVMSLGSRDHSPPGVSRGGRFQDHSIPLRWYIIIASEDLSGSYSYGLNTCSHFLDILWSRLHCCFLSAATCHA